MSNRPSLELSRFDLRVLTSPIIEHLQKSEERKIFSPEISEKMHSDLVLLIIQYLVEMNVFTFSKIRGM